MHDQAQKAAGLPTSEEEATARLLGCGPARVTVGEGLPLPAPPSESARGPGERPRAAGGPAGGAGTSSAT